MMMMMMVVVMITIMMMPVSDDDTFPINPVCVHATKNSAFFTPYNDDPKCTGSSLRRKIKKNFQITVCTFNLK